MRKILFYYDNYCGAASRGGTEVATARIAAALAATGECTVYNAFLRSRGEATDGPPYKAAVRLHKASLERELAEFIRQEEIDVVVNMGRFFRHERLAKAIGKSGHSTRLVFMHHFAPGSEKKKTTYASGLRLLRLDPFNPLYWLRATFYPIVKLPRRLAWKRIYRKVYDMSQAVVLLSDGYREEYIKVARADLTAEGDRFRCIPNIYDAESPETSPIKEKRVLILSRMDEIQKRISLALKVWRILEHHPDLTDWSLDIVGSGHELRALRKLASRLGLKRAVFHGWADGNPFLQRDSILMSTSDYEGLSLSMIEAQAYGCVPVAFDSYASLSDVVADGVTGVTVHGFGDVEAYAQALASLMRDPARRSGMAACGRRSAASAFSSERIASLWLALLKELD